MSDKSETITIVFKGTKKFRQALVDRIYEFLMEDDLFLENWKPGCEFTFDSTIAPTEEKE